MVKPKESHFVSILYIIQTTLPSRKQPALKAYPQSWLWKQSLCPTWQIFLKSCYKCVLQNQAGLLVPEQSQTCPDYQNFSSLLVHKGIQWMICNPVLKVIFYLVLTIMLWKPQCKLVWFGNSLHRTNVYLELHILKKVCISLALLSMIINWLQRL